MINYTAFDSFSIVSKGNLEVVALDIRKRLKDYKITNILIFSDLTGRQIDLDLSGTQKQVLNRLKIYCAEEVKTSTGAGRPKLGVVPREVSLLPHHWEWLINQDGGSSLVIRNLIDEKINNRSIDKTKMAQERTYKFLSALAGNLPNFEEATRYLYRKDKKKFLELISSWPKDVVKHSLCLSSGVFD